MTDYARLRVLVEVDTNASFTRAEQHSVEYSGQIVDAGVLEQRVDAVPVTGTTVSLAYLSSINLLVLEVPTVVGSTPYVKVTWKSADTAANTARVLSGSTPLVLCDVDPATDLNLLASVGTVPCALTLIGA